jgi:nucleotide-binding universal stress UspA family protein
MTTNDDTSTAERMDGPTGAAPPQCHLVVGFDRRPTSRAALICAIDLARRLNAFLHVMHIVDDDDMPIDPDAEDWEDRIADVVEQERRTAKALLSALPGNWTYYSTRGKPTELLANLADANDALMIVLGASRGGMASVLEKFWGESVSSALTHHSHRPVLLVPATDTTR